MALLGLFQPFLAGNRCECTMSCSCVAIMDSRWIRRPPAYVSLFNLSLCSHEFNRSDCTQILGTTVLQLVWQIEILSGVQKNQTKKSSLETLNDDFAPGSQLSHSIGGYGSWSPTCLVAAPGLCYTLHQLPLQTLGFCDAHQHRVSFQQISTRFCVFLGWWSLMID